MIFFKKEPILGMDLETAINNAVFPGLQGGPHNHTIAGLAACLKGVATDEFRKYQQQIKSNCKALAKRLVELGYTMVFNGTDNHLVLVDLRPLGIDGARAEKVLDIASITLNKNSVPGDKSVVVPCEIRIGTPTLTIRGFGESDFFRVADFIHEGVQIAIKAKKVVQDAKLKTYLEFVDSESSPFKAEIKDLRQRVEGFATKFPIPAVGTGALFQ